MSDTQSKPAPVWWYALGGVLMCPVLAVLFILVAILLIIMLPAVPFLLAVHRRDTVLKMQADVAEDTKGKRIAELESAFDLLHEHLEDIIEKERINVLCMDDEFLEKRGKAMRMRHTTLPSERRD